MRNWGAFSIFNVWTSDVHSLWGYYLAASLFLLCGSFVNFMLAIGIGSLVIFVLMNLVGYAGVKTGVPYPVLARASFGIWGANLPALVRAIVACFWYGAQTAAASGAIVALLTRSDALMAVPPEHAFPRPLGAGGDLLRHRLGAAAADHPARHGDGAAVPGLGRPGGVGDDADPGDRPVRQGRRLLVRRTRFRRTCCSRRPRTPAFPASRARSAALMAVGGDLDHLFRRALPEFLRLLALRAGQGGGAEGQPLGPAGQPDRCSRWSPASPRSPPSRSIDEVLLHPDQISAKFDSWFLALLAALTFAVATLGINVVANFVSPAFDFSNVFPKHDRLQEGRLYRGADRAGALSLRAVGRQRRRASSALIGATMGPIFGIIMVDYYLIAQRQGRRRRRSISEDGEYRYQSGWNVNALIAAGDRRAVLDASCRTSPRSCRPGGASMAGSSASRSRARSIMRCGVAMPSPVAKTA